MARVAQVEPLTTARAVRGPFDYALPEGLRDRVAIGSMLVVPFGRRELLGVVVGLAEGSARSLPSACSRRAARSRRDVPRRARRAGGLDRARVLLDAGARASLVLPPGAAAGVRAARPARRGADRRGPRGADVGRAADRAAARRARAARTARRDRRDRTPAPTTARCGAWRRAGWWRCAATRSSRSPEHVDVGARREHAVVLNADQRARAGHARARRSRRARFEPHAAARRDRLGQDRGLPARRRRRRSRRAAA